METILYNYREQNLPLRQTQEDAYIAGLDPLGADGKIRNLPVLNETGDLDGLVACLYAILPSPVQLENFDYYEAAAAMRDIGFLLGSIKKLGKEPVDVVPELDYVLGELGARTNLPPRDTLLHYSVWNPDGIRQRSYTNTRDEFYLIKSVKVAMHPVISAIYQLRALHEIDPCSAAFAERAEEIASTFKGMILGMVVAKREVSPKVFAQTLRFYFDPITLYKREYIGPGAVELPMFVYDQLLWVGKCEHKEYKKFQQTYVPYILPHLRTVYERYQYQESLLDKLTRLLCEPGIYNPHLSRSAKALERLMKQLVSLRMPHKKMAEQSYKHEKAKRSTGSGGYSTDILHTILDLCMDKNRPFETALREYVKKGVSVNE